MQRLVVFCSEIETDLERVQEALAELLRQHGLEDAELRPMPSPEGMAEAGWMAVTLRVPGERKGHTAEKLGDHLEAVTSVFARTLSDPVLGVWVNGAQGQARACLHQPGKYPRSSRGESFHVIRQAASWVEADPNGLVRYFNAQPQRNELVGPLDLSDVDLDGAPSAAPAGPDDEDRYVEAKLQTARELMAMYLGNRK